MKHVISFVLLVFGLSATAQTIMNIYQNNGTVLQIPLSSIDSITYTVNNPGNLATLNTLPIGNVSASGAESGGNITNDGGTTVTQRGVCWSTSPNPTTANNTTSDGSGLGSYASTLTGLVAGSTYYVRAYAINSAGTAYGNELSFATTAGAGSITALNCGSASNSGALTVGGAANEVSSTVPYAGGNGGTHNGQTVASTGVTGLTASLVAGSFVSGTGSLTYTITGIPSSVGSANFSLSIGGQNCTLSRTVDNGGGLYAPGPGVSDINGNSYATIIMNNGQEWMAENLRTTTYANGDPIPNVTDNTAWTQLTTGAWAHYNNESQYESTRGKLYNWYAVADPRNVCPLNWHVPTEGEWQTLEAELGMPGAELVQTGFRGNAQNVGGKMKAASLWDAPNIGATNEGGFSGLPGGFRFHIDGGFIYLTMYGYWWSASESNANTAWYRSLSFNVGSISRDEYAKGAGWFVRCVRD